MTYPVTCFCGNKIPVYFNVLWCNDCIDEFLDLPDPKDIKEFIEAKKKQFSDPEERIKRNNAE